MAKFKLQRYFSTKVNLGTEEEPECVGLRFKRLSATDTIAYSHEVSVLQDKLDGGDNAAVKDIYVLNIDLLCSQVVEITDLLDEDGNEVGLPSTYEEKKELFDDLGIDFIVKACNQFSEGAKPSEGNDKKSDPT
jgi:hypothetical protein